MTAAKDRSAGSAESVRLRRAAERVTEATRSARDARIAAADDLRARAVRRSRWLRGSLAAGVVVALVLAATAIVVAVVAARAAERTTTQGEVLAAARSAVTTMLTSDPAHADAYVAGVIALSTGPARERLEKSRPALAAAIAAQPSASQGRVLDAGLVSDPGTDDTGAGADVLLVAQASNPALVGGDPDADRITLKLRMVRTGGGWLVASVVPA